MCKKLTDWELKAMIETSPPQTVAYIRELEKRLEETERALRVARNFAVGNLTITPDHCDG